MPLTNTPGSLPDFVSGAQFTGSDIPDRMKQIEFWLNGGVGTGELRTSAWCGAEKVARPLYYGAPADRSIGQAWHSWHRFGGARSTDHFLAFEDFSPGEYTPIPDLTATIHVPPIDTGGTVGLLVVANWYCWEHLGQNATFPSDARSIVSSKFRLFVDGTPYGSSQRQLGVSGDSATQPFYTRKDHSLVFYVPSISAGRHDVGIQMAVLPSTDLYDIAGTANPGTGLYRDWLHCWVGVRSFLTDILLL